VRMLDSITVANLPAGADAYLGYTDGSFLTYPSLKAKFPDAIILPMAVFSSSPPVEGYDGEPGDISPTEMPGCVRRSLDAGIKRPVVYASAVNMPAYLAAIETAGIQRSQVRLLSAHYNGKHICGPSTCAQKDAAGRVVPACDGTQWTDQAVGNNGTRIDESLLIANFFGGTNNVVLGADDIAAIVKAVWGADGSVTNPNANPTNKTWPAAEMLEDIDSRVRAIQTAVAAEDPAALAKAVLAGLSPEAIATAIAGAVDADVAKAVVTALGAKLSS